MILNERIDYSKITHSMTSEELSMIERRLEVTLPTAYKRILSKFPWPRFAGAANFSLWDNALLNIERTLEYRTRYGGAPPWPKNVVHIGDDDDACPYVLRCGDGTVVKTDHGNLNARPLATFPNVDAFVRGLPDARA